VIPLTRAIPERNRGGLRRCAIQIDVYCTYFALLLTRTNVILRRRGVPVILHGAATQESRPIYLLSYSVIFVNEKLKQKLKNNEN